MEKRQLTPEEKEQSLRSKTRIEEEINDMQQLLEICQFKKKTEVPFNYKTQLRQYNDKLKELNEEITIKTEMLKVLNDQLENGVIIKEAKQ